MKPNTYTLDRFARFMVRVVLPAGVFGYLLFDAYSNETAIPALKGAALLILLGYFVLALREWMNKEGN